MKSKLDASVVIGFRDWGIDRIRRSAQSIKNSFEDANGEIIISDYGSSDPKPAQLVAEEVGARYVYTPGDPVWSRARALNAGFAIAEGDLLISTDADMLFSPGSLDVIIRTAQEAEDCALFLQCRDLPSGMGDEFFADNKIDWKELEEVGRLRPRWGMGGMMAIPRTGFQKIRGFDERLHTYGGEDLDFAQRARRAGYRTIWVDDPRARMYHMWHPATIRTVQQTDAGRAAVSFNKNVVYNDKSYTRNISGWRNAPKWGDPLVTVAIATRDRPTYLIEAVRSIQAQSVQDFEIIVVDDGSELDIRAPLEALGDPRIRYVYQEPSGISIARNHALDISRGYYTAVMDDDDIIPPKRLEWQLSSITAGYVGSVGSFINFDDKTGELELIVSKIPSIAQAAEKGGAPGHGTWLIRTDIMRTIRYEDTIPSGIDNNFFLRLLRAGYKVTHCGQPVLLRRRHFAQVTTTDSNNQTDAAKQSLQFFQFGLSKWHKTKLSEDAKAKEYPDIEDTGTFQRQVIPYLPDHLVSRKVSVTLDDEPTELPSFDGVAEIRQTYRGDVAMAANLSVRDASYSDLARMAMMGKNLAAAIQDDSAPATEPWINEVIRDYAENLPSDYLISLYRDAKDMPSGIGFEVYTRTANGENQSVSVTASPAGEIPQGAPWMIYGASAERFLR